MLAKSITTELKEKHFIPVVYFYGEIEKMLDYDLVCTDDKELLDQIFNIEETLVKPVEVIENGKIIHAFLFVWRGLKFGWTKGLVVSIDDDESIKFATKLMEERSDSLS